jgi:hypothetical protein
MSTLISRIKEHESAKSEYWLDYVTLITGFTYRHLDVRRYDEDGILTTQKRPNGTEIEVYLKLDQIATAQIVTL